MIQGKPWWSVYERKVKYGKQGLALINVSVKF